MYKESWGEKRICPMCRSSYFDLGRTVLECPSCGKEIEVSNLARPRRGRKPGSGNALKINPTNIQDKPKQNETEDIESIEDVEDKTDDTVIEDDTLLIEEEDDIDPALDAGVEIKPNDSEDKEDI